ncbi:MAG: molecular chaperone HtpG [Terrimicrobiaceae bacterium]|nr:molecular chaperone HtpG [Terrimicrobiaceae bacterium]
MSAPEKHEFQAEIAQLLNIVIHSLYTDKEIFIRELISNAADATEKLKFLQTSGSAVFEPDRPLAISVTTDDTAHSISIADSGIGMTHDELVENLGTIAHSGSKAFLEQLKAGAGKPSSSGDPGIIGQFGVGFYSAFMVASKVTVFTRSFQPDETGWIWTSDGVSSYEIEPAADLPRGTKIVIQLAESDREYSRAHRVESIIKRYSNFVGFPIELNGSAVNTVSAIWTRNKSEVTDADYDEFYKFLGHDIDAPHYRLHFNADAPLAIRALLFVPKHSLEKPGMPKIESEIHLYCRRILIQSKARGLLPEWLRFVKGVVDSEDLPLNISRETMQDSALMQKLNKVLTARFLKFLDGEANGDPESYAGFFKEFGHFLKEGIVSDYAHREPLAKLLRYETSVSETPSALADYVARMPEDQKEIYYISGADRAACLASPYYEGLKAKSHEALFLHDPWDEFVMDQLREFDGRKLIAAEKAEIALEKTEDTLDDTAARLLCNFIKESLGDKVGDVRVSRRLVDSPAVVVESDKGMTSSMRRILKNLNRGEAPPFKQDLEINPNHPMMLGLENARKSQPELAKQVAEQVHDNALIAAGLLEDPQSMLKRMNALLEQLVTK